MDEKTLFMTFWKKEAATTRKVIARIPQEKSDYRADPKARNAREIAWVILREQIALADGLDAASFSWAELPAPATVAAILETYDRVQHDLAARMDRLSSEHWARPMPFMFGGQEVMRDTGYQMAWGFLFDIIHHRGQLSTYLRPMGSTVPAIYGPSADEQT